MSLDSDPPPQLGISATHVDRLPRVSVAMCTCNGERFLDAQIASVLAQQGVEVELIISDDASTDGTWEKLQAWAARSDAIRILRHEHRLGLHANLTHALSHCTEDLIAPCDQDDIWHPQKLMRLCTALTGPNMLAYCDSELVDETTQPLGINLSDRFGMYSGSGVLPLCFWNSVSGHAMLFRHRLLGCALPFPPSFLPDWWLAICAANRGMIAYVDEPLVKYRQHADSQTDVAQRRRTERDSWRIYDERTARLRAIAGLVGPDQAYLQQLSSLWVRRANQRWCWRLVAHMASRRRQLVQLKRGGGFARFAIQMLAGQRWRARKHPPQP